MIIFLSLLSSRGWIFLCGKKIFRFEEMWLSNRGCEEVVFSTRNSGDTLRFEGHVLAKIDKCGKDLSWWNKNVFGNMRRELEHLKKLLVEAESAAMATVITFGLDSLRRRLMCCWIGSLLYGLNGQDYYGQGMGIGIHFHSRATKRYRRNKVEGIRDEEGNWRD